MINVLIIYNKEGLKNRQSLEDSIFCFKKYYKKANFIYYNYWEKINLFGLLSKHKFDGIIYHYSFMALRYSDELWLKIMQSVKPMKYYIQAVMVQDEYINNKKVCDFIIQQNVRVVFTLARGNSIKQIYPDIPAKFVTVLPGYVDPERLNRIQRYYKKYDKQADIIDIGYRARKLNESLGKQGYLKAELAEKFNLKLKETNFKLKTDIKTTDDTKNVFMGMEWYRFLIKCRTMLGCLGGASILDEQSELYKCILAYKKEKPDVLFEEISKKFLSKLDGNLKYETFSPRFFECAMTKTCQILVEGDYYGILFPDVHFIEIKRDFSNIEEVITKVNNTKLCEKIVQNAYRDLIVSEKYTYEKFVQNVMEQMPGIWNERIRNKKIKYVLLKIFLKSYELLLFLKNIINIVRVRLYARRK